MKTLFSLNYLNKTIEEQNVLNVHLLQSELLKETCKHRFHFVNLVHFF